MTAINTQNVLCQRLAEVYPNQARNLITMPAIIRIDDRDGGDIYPGYCDIHLRIDDPQTNQFHLTLDNVPFNDDVKELAAELDGTWESTRTGERLTLNLSTSQKADLRRLATAIRKVVGRGQRYDDSNWKWIAPRTAKSLEGFARLLSALRKP